MDARLEGTVKNYRSRSARVAPLWAGVLDTLAGVLNVLLRFGSDGFRVMRDSPRVRFIYARSDNLRICSTSAKASMAAPSDLAITSALSE
jgi:hypothetical protein